MFSSKVQHVREDWAGGFLSFFKIFLSTGFFYYNSQDASLTFLSALEVCCIQVPPCSFLLQVQLSIVGCFDGRDVVRRI